MGRFPAVLVALGAAALAACGSVAATSVPHTLAAHPGSSPSASSGLFAAASAANCPAPNPAASKPSATAAVKPPVVGAKAFAGHGRLAFVSSGRLYVLDGTTRGKSAVLHAVAAPAGAVAPAWSHDGRWLAFLVAPGSFSGQPLTGTLWLACTDGQAARPVLANAGPFHWSPTADVLVATVTDPAAGRTTVYELRPGSSPKLLPGVTGTAVWSPNGRELAFTNIQTSPRTGFTGSALETIPAAGGKPAVVARSTANALLISGWWPNGRGLLAWADPLDSASLAADGAPLVSYPLAGGRPVTLGTTLLHSSFAATSKPGQTFDFVALVAGGDRILWNGKTIVQCGMTGGCVRFPGGLPGPLNLDPAWSPSQEPTLAFVHGKASWPGDFSQRNIAAWYATRKLWVYTQGGNPYLVSGAGAGIAAPVWSKGGKIILYVRDNALWLINPFGGHGNPSPGQPSRTGGPPTRVVAALFAGAWPNFFGYIDWQDQFAWQD